MPMYVTIGRVSLLLEIGLGGVAVKCFKLFILARAAVLAGHSFKPEPMDGMDVEVFGRSLKPRIEGGPWTGFGTPYLEDCTLPIRNPIELSNHWLQSRVPGRATF